MGYTDMNFAIKQLVEKSWEHRTKTFLVQLSAQARNSSWLASCIEVKGARNHGPTDMWGMKTRISLNGTLLE